MRIDESNYTDIPNGKSGIYMLIGEDEEILYIGKSKNLKYRLGHYFGDACHWGLNHLEEFENLIKCAEVSYINIENLESTEKNLIGIHKPPLNIVFNAKFTKRYELRNNHVNPEDFNDLEEPMKNFRNK